jgi:hypothetical protein
MRAIAPELIDILGEGGELTLRNAAGQTIEGNLGQNAARLHPRRGASRSSTAPSVTR